MRNLHLFSLLLSYPTEELQSVCGEIEARLAGDPSLPSDTIERLAPLLNRLATSDIYVTQEAYVDLFDRGRTHCLHLFEHVHGESRDRGQAMVDLKAMYEKADLFIAANELPDFLPLFLEFLSTRSLADARELLGQTTHILAALAERIDRRKSAYKAVFDALVAISATAPSRKVVDELLKSADPDPMDLVALDAAWEEEEVRFGPGSQGQGACGHESLIAKLRHARRAVDPAPHQQ